MAEPDSQGPSHDSPSASPGSTQSGADAEHRWSELEETLREELAPGMELVRLLGRGSMASVYLAREAALRRLVAIKVLDPVLARDEVTRLRFEREGQAVASISHPNVVTIYGVDRLTSDIPYLVMQYVKGRTLANRIQAEHSFDPSEAQSIISDVARALDAAHRRGIVHRDLRPDNVLLESESGRVILTDFGLAGILPTGNEIPLNLTRPGEILGDPRYAGPELHEGRDLTELADIYSLGVMAYELLTFLKPDEAAADAGTDTPPPVTALRGDVDPALASVIQACLSPVPSNRPSAKDVARQLSQTHPGRHAPAAGGNAPANAATRPGGASVDPGQAARAAIMGQPFPTATRQDQEEEEPDRSIFKELKRRKVFRVAIFYLIYAWLAAQVSTTVFPHLGLPDWSITFVIIFVCAGFPVALVLGWIFDITSEGVKRTRSMD